MLRVISIIAAVVIILHGLAHLLVLAVYLKLTTLPNFAYKTTLLNGGWDLGDGGILVFGLFLTLPAIGFILAGIAWLAGWNWWQPVLVVAALVSLVLTGSDWSVAYAGAIIDLLILAVLWFGPRIAGQISRQGVAG